MNIIPSKNLPYDATQGIVEVRFRVPTVSCTLNPTIIIMPNDEGTAYEWTGQQLFSGRKHCSIKPTMAEEKDPEEFMQIIEDLSKQYTPLSTYIPNHQK